VSALLCARCGANLNPLRARYFAAQRNYGQSSKKWLVALGATCARDVQKTVSMGGEFRVTRSGMLVRVAGSLERRSRAPAPPPGERDKEDDRG
jgi:hypothetical protein